MKRLAVFSFLVAVSCLIATASHAATGKRVALVVGNANYAHTTALKNPSNDATGMAAVLKRLGFEVIEGIDLTQAAMLERIRTFGSEIENADVALFFYAGHALQVHGNNYLAPVDVKLNSESDLDFEAVPLNLVLRQMERGQRTNLVFLDACRDNPLAQKLARSMATRSGAVGRGLAKVESGLGMMISYSTSPGEVAYDGQGKNSPYTKALLTHIEAEGVDVSSMMINVRRAVLEASNGKQIPWEHSSLTGQFFFKPAPERIAEATPAPDPQPDQSDLFEQQKFVASAYNATVAVGTCGAYRAFEEQHRGSFYGRLAEEHLRKNCGGEKRAIAVESAEAPTPQSPPQQTVVATAEPGPGPVHDEPAPQAPVLTGADLVYAIQKQLDRVRCDPGKLDGEWGNNSQDALERFAAHAKVQIPTEWPSQIALAALEAYQGPHCPVVAAPTHKEPAPVYKEKKRPVREAVKERSQPQERWQPKKAEPSRKKGTICFDIHGRLVDCDSPGVLSRH